MLTPHQPKNRCRLLLGALIAAALWILVGCSTTPKLISTRTPEATATSTAMVEIPTTTPLPSTHTATQTSPTPEPSQTPIPTQPLIPTFPVEANLVVRCLEINSQPPETDVYSGKVILEGDSAFSTKLMDMSSGVVSPPKEPVEYYLYEAVAPNHDWIAYKEFSADLLIVHSFIGEGTTLRIPWRDDWFGIEEWLNDRYLLIGIKGGAALILDPFSGQESMPFSDFPYLAEPVGSAADWWDPVYNASLTRVLYPTSQDNHIALWDLHKNKTIAYFRSEILPYGGRPAWSPDGKELVIALQESSESDNGFNELYRITQDGKLSKLTNLGISETKIYWFSQLIWSPDGSQIAFWTNNELIDTNFHTLAILDMETLVVKNYCIRDRWRTAVVPIWSPNSRQLIINSVYDDEDAVLLLDLDRELVFRIAGDLKALGWLNSSP